MAKSPERGTLVIDAAVVADIRGHAKNEAPRECCGLLIGSGLEVRRSVRARNLEAGTTRYRIDPADHFTAIHLAREAGCEVVGAYHSHPAGPAVPSPTDLAEGNSGPEFVHVIVSVLNDDVRAFRIVAGKAVPLPLSIGN